MHRLAALVTATSLVPVAVGQSLNVDFNRTSGFGAGAPSTSYGGAALQTGYWNGITPTSAGATSNLSNLNAVPLGVSLFHDASNSSDSADYGANDFERLMGDYAFGFTQSGNVEATFSGLQPGVYDVYVYAGLPPAEAYYDVFGTPTAHRATIIARRNNETGLSTTLQGATTNGTLASGVNYTRFTVPVLGGDSLSILALADLSNSSGKVALNGIQLTKWASPVVYVRPGGAGDRSGRSWTNAMSDLQAAMDLADRFPVDLDPQVWVAEGVYKPTSGSDRTASFRLPSGVKIYGGFGGTESSLSQRNWSTRLTQMSGEIGASTITDNCYHVLKAENFDRIEDLTVVDGFNIARGNANGSGDNARGGAALIRGARVEFRNCVIVGNRATNGGAIYVHNSFGSFCWVSVVRCLVSQNSATENGGAFYVDDPSTSDGGILINSSRMDRNSAGSNGGVLYGNGAYCSVVNSLVNGNSAHAGGAFLLRGNQGPSHFGVYASTLVHNTSNTGGGAIDFGTVSSITIDHSILWYNSSGGLTNRPAQVTLHSGASSVYYSNFEGSTLGWYDQGWANMSEEPVFVDRDGPNNVAGDADDDLHLAHTSPCIDAGGTNYLVLDSFDLDADGINYERLPFDLDLLPRHFDVTFVLDNGGGEALPDLGCFEAHFTSPPCPADFDDGTMTGTRDGGVTIDDLLYYLVVFEAGLIDADVDDGSGTGVLDGGVTIDDLLYFLVRFEAGC